VAAAVISRFYATQVPGNFKDSSPENCRESRICGPPPATFGKGEDVDRFCTQI